MYETLIYERENRFQTLKYNQKVLKKHWFKACMKHWFMKERIGSRHWSNDQKVWRSTDLKHVWNTDLWKRE